MGRLTIDAESLRAHYDTLNDEELGRLAGTELVPEARVVLEAEMKSRGLQPAAHATPILANPYAAPGAAVADPDAWATLKVSGLVRLFHLLVIASTLIGLFVFFWPDLPIPLTVPQSEEAGAGAIAPVLSYVTFWVLQPLWILCALGLYFFKWWARPLFAGTYVVSALAYLLGGMVVWLPWEIVLLTIATLMDGALFALAFLPPLSTYFERDKEAA